MDESTLFKQYLKELNKSELTIKSYMYDFENFRNYLKTHRKDMNSLILEDIITYKDYMINKGKKITTINRNIVSINHLLEYKSYPFKLHQEKVQVQNFLDEILTNTELKKLIEIAEIHNDIRAKTILSTLYYTGMRVSEALQLTIYDVDNKNIMIVGKGNKRREVFIPNILRDIWKEYLLVRKKKTNKLFTGQRGAINRHTVHKIIKRYAKKANIDLTKAHAHVLRHMYGKNLADREIAIDTIADLLGHSNINITRIYTRKTKQELLDIVNKF